MTHPLFLVVAISVVTETSTSQGEQSGQNSDSETPAVVTKAPEQVQSVVVQRVVRACQEALTTERCQWDEGDQAPAEGRHHAVVHFSEHGVTVTLRNVVSLDQVTETVRSLEFVPSDSEAQRQVAAGLLVAALSAGAAGNAEPPETPKATTSQDKPSSVAAENESSDAQIDAVRGFSLTFGAGLGAGLRPFVPRAGLRLGSAYQLSDLWSVGADVRGLQSFGESAREQEISVAATVDLALSGPMSPLGTWLSVAGALSYTRVSRVEGSALADTAWRGGPRLGLSFAPRWSRLQPWFGLDATLLLPEVQLHRDGKQISQLPALLAMAFVGLRYERYFSTTSSR